MFKVVVDTNIIVSAVIFGGKPDQIISLANKGIIKLYLSPFIFAETKKVLRKKFRWPPQKIKELTLSLQLISTVIHPKQKISLIKEKDSDNRILEAALEVRADFLISGDTQHLLPLKKWREIKIVSAQNFLKIFSN